jgi:hypothetical protein
LTTCLEKTILSEKMIEEDLSWVEQSATKSTYRLVVGFERCEDKGEKSTPSSFPAPPTTKRKQQSNPPKLITHPSQSHPSTQRERQEMKPLGRERKRLFACFVVVLVTWMSFTCSIRELRGGILSLLETHIVTSLLISHLVLILMFRLAFTLVLHLTFLHVLFLGSLMNLTIAHMVLVHERTALSLDALVMTHVLVIMIIYHIGLIFLLEGTTPTLSRDTWMVHVFPIVVHVPLG